ncbi:MAG TPA: carboxypeptidase-like regulatory domain-containing protein [Longimicrobiales bacterium]|nr:carboxypeptidase-like regulatory domain-containing protein [Longimicrobiales bacterium]
MPTRAGAWSFGGLALLVTLTAAGCDADPTASGRPLRSEIVLDLSTILGAASGQQQAVRTLVARAELDIDGHGEARDIGGGQTQVPFPVSLRPGTHDFEARVLSNTGVVLARGSAPGVAVSAEGFEVPIRLEAVTGVLFVTPADVAVGGSVSQTIRLENRGIRDLWVTVGPLAPPDDRCDDQIPCVSVFGFQGSIPIGPGRSHSLSAHAGPVGGTTFSLRLTASEDVGVPSEIGFVDLPITVTEPGVGTVEVALTIQGDAVAGATVILVGPLTLAITTNAAGEATFTDVPLGTWTVRAPGYDVQATTTLSYGGEVASVVLNAFVAPSPSPRRVQGPGRTVADPPVTGSGR